MYLLCLHITGLEKLLVSVINIILMSCRGQTSSLGFHIHTRTHRRKNGGWENVHITDPQTNTHIHFGSHGWALSLGGPSETEADLWQSPDGLPAVCHSFPASPGSFITPSLFLPNSLALPLPGQVLHSPRRAQMDGLSQHPMYLRWCVRIKSSKSKIQTSFHILQSKPGVYYIKSKYSLLLWLLHRQSAVPPFSLCLKTAAVRLTTMYQPRFISIRKASINTLQTVT